MRNDGVGGKKPSNNRNSETAALKISEKNSRIFCPSSAPFRFLYLHTAF